MVKTIATEGKGIPEVVKYTAEHYAWLEQSNLGQLLRVTVLSHVIADVASERIARRALQGKENVIKELAREVFERKKSALEAVEELVRRA